MHVLQASIIYLRAGSESLAIMYLHLRNSLIEYSSLALAEYSPEIKSYYSTGQHKLFKVIHYSEDWNSY